MNEHISPKEEAENRVKSPSPIKEVADEETFDLIAFRNDGEVAGLPRLLPIGVLFHCTPEEAKTAIADNQLGCDFVITFEDSFNILLNNLKHMKALDEDAPGIFASFKSHLLTMILGEGLKGIAESLANIHMDEDPLEDDENEPPTGPELVQ